MTKSIPAAEFRERVKRLQGKMAEENFDAVITFGGESEPQYVRYLSDYWPSFETAGVFVPLQGEPALLIGPESYTFAKAWSKIPDIRRLMEFRESSEPEYPGEVLTTLKELFEGVIDSGSNRKIGVVGYPLMPAPIYASIVSNANKFNCEVVRAERLLIELKQIKSDTEIELMRNAARISEKAFTKLLDIIKPGMTEIQVVGELQRLIREFGAESEAYPFWCISGENTNQAISRPTHRELKKGEMIQSCMGARLGGYASSFGRPFVFGSAPEGVLDLIRIGWEAQKTVIGSIKKGVEASEIDTKYREILEKNNAAEYMLYGPCHGTGLMEGEHPWIEKTSDFKLQENMTFCVDIFLQRDGYGLRCEDVVRVTKDGADEFTNRFREVLVL
jgi:Xaa-Pro aminopeptidase